MRYAEAAPLTTGRSGRFLLSNPGNPFGSTHQYYYPTEPDHEYFTQQTFDFDKDKLSNVWAKGTLSFPVGVIISPTSGTIKPPFEYIAKRFSLVSYPKLNDALRDLRNVTNEANEEGFPPPSSTASNNAERLLRAMYAISSRRYEIYPTPDREIAIDAPNGYGRSVILLCDSDGGALCLVNMNGNHRRARYSSTEILPDGFMREALIELEQQNG